RIAVDDHVAADAAGRHLANRSGRLALDLLQQRERRGDPIELARDEGEVCRRDIADDRKLDPIEIGPATLPILGVSGEGNSFVRLEFDEFEGTGADRVLSHIARRHVAWVDDRKPRGEQRNKRRLWPGQMESDLVSAVSGDLREVAVPRFAGIETKFL